MKASEFQKLTKEERKAVPFKEIPTINKVAFAITAFVLLLFIVLMVATCDDSTSKNVKKDSSVMASIIAKDYVKGMLKSPSTADFPFSDYQCNKIDSVTYVVRSYVDSQNGFGAMIRTKYTITLRYLGGDDADPHSWSMVDIATE